MKTKETPSIENLKAQMRGVKLNIHQKGDVLNEWNNLLRWLDSYKVVGGWINFKDELPKVKQKIVIWLEHPYKAGGHSMNWSWEAENTEKMTINSESVTHWIPLPDSSDKK